MIRFRKVREDFFLSQMKYRNMIHLTCPMCNVYIFTHFFENQVHNFNFKSFDSVMFDLLFFWWFSVLIFLARSLTLSLSVYVCFLLFRARCDILCTLAGWKLEAVHFNRLADKHNHTKNRIFFIVDLIFSSVFWKKKLWSTLKYVSPSLNKTLKRIVLFEWKKL